MDAKTKDLLLKIRKGATASITVGQLAKVLPLVGWKVELKKEGREQVAATFTAPSGAKLTEKKEQGYRIITLYEFWRFAKGQGLSDACSRALGMSTLDEQKATKQAARTIENTGTCGVCFGNFKLDEEKLVLHGYQRPGHGYIQGRCYAVGYQPYELDVTATKEFLAKYVKPNLEAVTHRLKALKEGKVDAIVVGMWSNNPKTVTRDDPDWEYRLREAIWESESDQRTAEREVAFYEGKVDSWKLDQLPWDKAQAVLAKRK